MEPRLGWGAGWPRWASSVVSRVCVIWATGIHRGPHTNTQPPQTDTDTRAGPIRVDRHAILVQTRGGGRNIKGLCLNRSKALKITFVFFRSFLFPVFLVSPFIFDNVKTTQERTIEPFFSDS